MTTSIQNIIKNHSIKHPDSIAIVEGDHCITYKQLEELSNRFARMLMEAGCVKGDRICLVMDKSIEAIVSLLGILKAGLIYIPVAPATNSKMYNLIVKAGKVRWIIANKAMNGYLQKTYEKFQRDYDYLNFGWLGSEPELEADLMPEFVWKNIEHYSPEQIPIQNVDQTPACILFKQPGAFHSKGIIFDHSNILYCAKWVSEFFEINQNDSVSSTFPMHFAHSCFDLFGALYAGARLELIPGSTINTPERVVNFLHDKKITHGFVFPGVVDFIAKDRSLTGVNGFQHLKHLVFWDKLQSFTTHNDCLSKLAGVKVSRLYSMLKLAWKTHADLGTVSESNGIDFNLESMSNQNEEVSVFGEVLKPFVEYDPASLNLNHFDLKVNSWSPVNTNETSQKIDTSPFSLDYYN